MCIIFKQKTTFEMRISDWSSDVCSSDLHLLPLRLVDERPDMPALRHRIADLGRLHHLLRDRDRLVMLALVDEHARRRDAALARIDQHPHPPGRARLVERRAFTYHIGRFASTFPVPALAGIGRGLRDTN